MKIPSLIHRDGTGKYFLYHSLTALFGVGLTLILPNWMVWIGWMLITSGVIQLLAVERNSRPPLNNLAAFQRRWKQQHPSLPHNSNSKHNNNINQNQQTTLPPILACVGASMVQGAMSANFVNRIRPTLFQKLGSTALLDAAYRNPLSDPLWVVNLGQNSLVSWTVYHERLASVLSCHPDYVLIMLGTNDVRAMYKKEYSKVYEELWNLPKPPTWEDYRSNMEGIVQCLKDKSSSSSTSLQIAMCTLPPMGEDLQHPANDLVRKANIMIHDIAQQRGCTVIPVYEALEEVIRYKQQQQQQQQPPPSARAKRQRRRRRPPPTEKFNSLAGWMGPLHYFGYSWNRLSRLVGHHVLTDTLHLNDDAGEIIANLVAQWLVNTNIQARLTTEPKQSLISTPNEWQ